MSSIKSELVPRTAWARRSSRPVGRGEQKLLRLLREWGAPGKEVLDETLIACISDRMPDNEDLVSLRNERVELQRSSKKFFFSGMENGENEITKKGRCKKKIIQL